MKQTNSPRPIRKFETIAKVTTLLAVSQLTACLSPIRDQAQVDPIVSLRDSNPLDNQQPSADFPRCSSSEWIERANSGTSCPELVTPKQLRLKASAMPGNSVELRNATQAELMTFSDLECKYHQAGIFSNQSGINFFSSITSLALSTAASVVSRGQGKAGNSARNFAAGASFFGGARGLVNSEIYFSYIAPAVISEIELIRKNERAQVLGRQRCSVSAYPPARAINDALNYHETCSFVSGLSSLLKKAGVQTRSGDPLPSQAAAINLRLVNIESELTAARTALNALTTADTVQYATLTAQVKLLENERLRWKDIQVLVGAANPERYGYDPTSFKSKQETAKLSLEVADSTLAALKSAVPANATAIIKAETHVVKEKKRVNDANDLAAKARVFDRQIREMQIEISALSQRLYDELQKPSPSKGAIAQFQSDRKKKTEALVLLQKEQRDLGLPDGFADQFNDDVCIAP